jgi:hypothetical protein
MRPLVAWSASERELRGRAGGRETSFCTHAFCSRPHPGRGEEREDPQLPRFGEPFMRGSVQTNATGTTSLSAAAGGPRNLVAKQCGSD